MRFAINIRKNYLYFIIALIIILSVVIVYSANIIYDGEQSHNILWTNEIKSKNTENKLNIFGNLCLNNKCISSWKNINWQFVSKAITTGNSGYVEWQSLGKPPSHDTLWANEIRSKNTEDKINILNSLCLNNNCISSWEDICSIPPKQLGCTPGNFVDCQLGETCDIYSFGIKTCKEDGTFGECEEPFVGCCPKYVYNSAGSVNLGCSGSNEKNAETTNNYCSVGSCYKCKEGYKVYDRYTGCISSAPNIGTIPGSGTGSGCPECGPSESTPCSEPNGNSYCASLYGPTASCKYYFSGDFSAAKYGYCYYFEPIPSGSICFTCVGACFKENTFITLADGNKKLIKDLKIGEKIIGWNENKQEKEISVIKKVIIHNNKNYDLNKVVFSSGDSFEATSNHPVYIIGKGWVQIKDLSEGDKVYKTVNDRMDVVYVASIIKDYSETGVVYNLETTSNDYFAQDILVHNKCLGRYTSISLAGDSLKSIKDILPGQYVIGNSNGKKVLTKVTNVFQKNSFDLLPGKLIRTDNSHIKSSDNHLFKTINGLKKASELKIGDKLVSLEGIETILSIRDILFDDEVYDIKTEIGNYYANNLLVEES